MSHLSPANEGGSASVPPELSQEDVGSSPIPDAPMKDSVDSFLSPSLDAQVSDDVSAQDVASNAALMTPEIDLEKRPSAMENASISTTSSSEDPTPEHKKTPQVEQPADSASSPERSFFSRLFDGCAAFGPLILVILWAGQAVSQWIGHESRGLFVVADSIRQTLSGGAAPAGIPEWSIFSGWLEAGGTFLRSIVPVVPGHVSSGGDLLTILALLVLILLTWGLARVTGYDRREALAAGLVILISAMFMDLPDIAGQELVASAFFVLSLLCLYRGWIKTWAPVSLLCGFVLIVPATLAGGIIAFVVPLIASFLFLIWRGTFRRAGARDGALGFGAMLVLFLAWGSWMVFSGGGREALSAQVYSLFLNPLQHAATLQISWNTLICLALLWIPWVFLPIFLPWACLGGFVADFYRNRTQNPGHGWIWCCLLTGLVAFALFDASLLMLFLLMPILAVLTARAILGLSQLGSTSFMFCVAGLLILLGIASGIAPFESGFLGVPALSAAFAAMAFPSIQETLIHTGLFVVFGVLLWKLTRRASSGGSLLVFAVLMIMLAAPLAWLHPVADEATNTEAAPAPATEMPLTEPVPSTESIPSDSTPSSIPDVPATVQPETESPAVVSQPEAAPASASPQAAPLIPPATKEGSPTEAAPAEAPAEQVPVAPETLTAPTDPIAPIAPTDPAVPVVPEAEPQQPPASASQTDA